MPHIIQIIQIIRVLLLLALGLQVSDCCADKPEAGIVVVMSSNTSAAKLSREQLVLIFKSRKTFWDDGLRIQAVNLPVTHPVRRAFSLQLFKQTPEEMDEYWTDMYFHGVLPPFVLSSEEAVIRFVSSTPGAIGYISHCAADRRVAIVYQFESSSACPRQN